MISHRAYTQIAAEVGNGAYHCTLSRTTYRDGYCDATIHSLTSDYSLTLTDYDQWHRVRNLFRRPWVTQSEAALILGRDRTTVHHHVRAGHTSRLHTHAGDYIHLGELRAYINGD